MSQSQKMGLPSQLLVSLLSAVLVMPVVVPVAYAQSTQQTAPAKLSEAQLSALVAPIALYPDALVAQLLMAATYPLEVAEAANWQKANSNLKGDALNQALQQQNWDASVKSLVSFPPVLQMMGAQLSWTQELGNAVLAQQSDVMSAIQALRVKAQQNGSLKSTAQQQVSGGNDGSPIVIVPANPQVIYVPTYNPAIVYGGWPYPAYPPYAYYPPGYVAGAAFMSFGAGMVVGAALWGGCHWGGGWGGGNSITVNNNTYNNFNQHTAPPGGPGGAGGPGHPGGPGGTSNWQPDAQRHNANMGGQAGPGGASRDAQRDQLRQSLQRDGFNGGNHGGQGANGNNQRQSAANNRGAPNNGRPSEGQGNRNNGGSGGQRNSGHAGHDPGGFGDTHGARFGSSEGFGGGHGGGRFGGRR